MITIAHGFDFDLAALNTADENSTPFHLSQNDYEGARDRLYQHESQILRTLGFQPLVALPYTLCINYLQALDVFADAIGPLVAKRAFMLINNSLLSPQMLHITHQPSAIAVASIYLAAREVGAKLPEVEWWEVFDVDREELGFLVVALQSLEGFAAAERGTWAKRRVPLTVKDLRRVARQVLGGDVHNPGQGTGSQPSLYRRASWRDTNSGPSRGRRSKSGFRSGSLDGYKNEDRHGQKAK